MCLWFIHQVSSLNIACVCDLSIMCLVSRLHVSLMYPSCVFFQSCMCLWLVHYVSHPNTACVWFVQEESLRQDTEWTNQRHMQHWDKTHNGQTRDTCSIKTKHIMDKPETQAVLGQATEWTNQRQRQYWGRTQNGQARDTGSIGKRHRIVHSVSCFNAACASGLSILWLVPILPVSLACPLCVLSQCCLCLWFVHSVSCPNTVCVSGLSILCLASKLPLSLVCPFCGLSQNCLCLWLVHYVFCLNTACVSGLSILCLVSMIPLSLVCPFSFLVPILP
jgi:hypothetical protein